jgi:hypothetical protein
MLGWIRCGCHKKCSRTHYAELVILHLVPSAGHVVSSGSSKAQNVDALLFVLGQTGCGSHKKRAGTSYTELIFLHPVQSMSHVVCSSVFRAQNVHVVFFMPRCVETRYIKLCVKTRYIKHVIFHLV